MDFQHKTKHYSYKHNASSDLIEQKAYKFVWNDLQTYKWVYSLRFIPKEEGKNLLIEMLQNMPVLCLHMHSGMGYAITSLSLLLALISVWTWDFLWIFLRMLPNSASEMEVSLKKESMPCLSGFIYFLCPI